MLNCELWGLSTFFLLWIFVGIFTAYMVSNKEISNEELVHPLSLVLCCSRTQAMKDGYMGELTAIQDNLNRSKMDLEDFYSQRHDDKNIVGELKDKMDKLIGSADTLILSFASGTKIVKAAVVA